MAWTDTFSVVTAMRSFSPRSAIDLTLGLRVNNLRGSAETAPMPRTESGVPLALAHKVMNTVEPALTMSSEPDSKPSFIGLPPGN